MLFNVVVEPRRQRLDDLSERRAATLLRAARRRPSGNRALLLTEEFEIG
jgi:hypothetical protein